MITTQSVKSKIDVLLAELKSHDPAQRFSAARSLGDIKNPWAVDALMKALKHEDYLVRCAAACALGELKERRAIKALTHSLQDSKAIVRQEAVGALGDIGRGQPGLRSATLEAQVAALQDPDPGVRRLTAVNLGDSRQDKWITFLADMLLEDSDSEVRLAAAEALGKIGKRPAIEPLTRALKSDRDDAVRQAAAGSLGRIKDRRIVDPLASAIVGDESSGVRAAAARASIRFPCKRMLAALRAASRDDDTTVRSDAAQALDRLIAKRAVRGLILVLCILVGSYVAVLAMSFVGSMLSERIETQRELRAVVVQEAKKLAINPDGVKCRLRPYFEGRIWFNHNTGLARLEVGGWGATRVGVRHELYHLARGHLEPGGRVWGFANDSDLVYYFIKEPQAIIYSCTGLRL